MKMNYPFAGNRILKTLLLTILALVAFAANSVLCRLALGMHSIDASSFTVLRLASGAIVLFGILSLNKRENVSTSKGSWMSSLMLLLYAAAFSFAYITLETGTGALILFAAVQITMILASLLSGNKLHYSEWLGMATAFLGFVYLVLPGVSAPPLAGFALMSAAGFGWGVYTLRGRNSIRPLQETAHNFARTIPLIVVVGLAASFFVPFHLSLEGILLAVLSGGLASGVGYTIWYAALRDISTTQAAVVQLSVPVIAALGGVMFMSEVVTARLILSSILILGGILVVVLGRYYFVQARSLAPRPVTVTSDSQK